MKSRQAYVYSAVRRVRAFFAQHPDLCGDELAAARRTLDAVERELALLPRRQKSSSTQALGMTAKLESLDRSMRNDRIQPILDIAALSKVEALKSLRMPRPRCTPLQMQTAVTAMANTVRPHFEIFTDFALPADFLDSMIAAAAAMVQTIDTRTQHVSTRIGSTQGLHAAEARAVTILGVLNSLVRPRISSNAQLLSQWDSCRRIEKKPGPAATKTLPPKFPTIVEARPRPVASAAAPAAAPADASPPPPPA
ncbi:MAG TPA: hypothetical protein VII52_06720 [Gemmatimonadaceae bacterium]